MVRLFFKISLLFSVLVSDCIPFGHAQQCEVIVATQNDFINTVTSVVEETFEEISCPQFESRLDAIETAVSKIGSAVESIKKQLDALSEVPSESCADILASDSNAPSGMYEVMNAEGQLQNVYCDMTTECNGVRGWTRLAFLDMSDTKQSCPAGLELNIAHNRRSCRAIGGQPKCTSVNYPSGGISYSRVCGRIYGHNQRTLDAFESHGPVRRSPPNVPLTIDSNYVDGVSLTYGSPRKHLWTFAASHRCSLGPVPQFVGKDYFRDTGTGHVAPDLQRPLWAGMSCPSHKSSCSSFNNPPWFSKMLPTSTTEDIEMRLCKDQTIGDEDIHISLVEILVR